MSKNDVAKIKANVRRYVAACNGGDADAFQKTLTNDAVFMPPDAPKLKGNKATAAYVKQTYFDPFRNKLRITFSRMQVIGSQAYGYGPFSLELTSKSEGNTIKGVGKHMAVFKKQKDGSWKYAQAIWNFDKPPA